jgi:uncharacterized protein (TIGR03067 family)
MSACIALVLGLPLPAAGTDDPPKLPKELVGSWALVRTENSGTVSTPEEGDPKSRLTFTAPDKGVFKAGEVKTELTVKVHTAVKPALIDVTLGDAGSKQTLEGIWKVEGDTLTICISPPEKKERPTEFQAGEGTGFILFTFQRDKE